VVCWVTWKPAASSVLTACCDVKPTTSGTVTCGVPNTYVLAFKRIAMAVWPLRSRSRFMFVDFPDIFAHIIQPTNNELQALATRIGYSSLHRREAQFNLRQSIITRGPPH